MLLTSYGGGGSERGTAEKCHGGDGGVIWPRHRVASLVLHMVHISRTSNTDARQHPPCQHTSSIISAPILPTGTCRYVAMVHPLDELLCWWSMGALNLVVHARTLSHRLAICGGPVMPSHRSVFPRDRVLRKSSASGCSGVDETFDLKTLSVMRAETSQGCGQRHQGLPYWVYLSES